MLNVALYEPEIPPNTGNIIRLCANCGAVLHLIGPLGFALTDKHMRRAGLDYHDLVAVHEYESWEQFLGSRFRENDAEGKLIAYSTKGKTPYTEIQHGADDILLFGPETRGLPPEILQQFPVATIPMVPNNRSLNLSNAVAVVLYEAWRQLKFKGAKG